MLLTLTAIGLGSGCSDPANPLPLQKLTAQASTADRLVVAASGDYADPNFKPVEIKGPGKAAELFATLEFTSKPRFYHSPIYGEYSIQCFSNEQRLVALTLRHISLTWELPDSSKEGAALKRSSLNTLLAWLATNGCDIPQREQTAQDAEKQRRLQAERNCVACFPPEVHKLFEPAPYGTEIAPWAAQRGRKLAATINNPVRLTVMASKAFGFLYDYEYIGEHEAILLNAVTNVGGADFVAALTEIQSDQRALLGASCLFFQNCFPERLPKTQACMWTAKLGEVVLDAGREEESRMVFQLLSKDATPEVLELLRRVARKGTGRTYTPRGLMGFEPLPTASAYLCLAMHGDVEVQLEIENLLPATTRSIDRTALELSLAVLSETNHVRPDDFQVQSCLVASAARKAVERFPNQENLDALVRGSFNPPGYQGWQMEETATLFERLVGNHWPRTAWYNGEIRQWWKTNRTRFPKAPMQAGQK